MIGVLPHAMATLGVGGTFALLAIGPLLGAIAMWRPAPDLSNRLPAPR